MMDGELVVIEPFLLLDIPPKMKMECLATYTMFGNIMSMQSVSLAGSSRDALLLSFKDAKLSVVEYDLDTHDLKTLSLHYFEEEEIRVPLSNSYPSCLYNYVAKYLTINRIYCLPAICQQIIQKLVTF